MRLYLLILLLSGCTIAQKDNGAKTIQPASQTNASSVDDATLTKQSVSKKNWLHTEHRYSDPVGRNIKVYNSLPRGGAYTTTGKRDGYRIFWNSIVNESTSPLKLVIELPIDAFPTFTASNSYLKALIPPNVMTLDKLELPDFGVTNINSLLGNGFKKPSRLETMIKPKGEYFYYTLFLLHETQAVTRSALVVRGENLFYEVSLDSQPPVIIPCGHIETGN